jgi:hypothetical protein
VNLQLTKQRMAAVESQREPQAATKQPKLVKIAASPLRSPRSPKKLSGSLSHALHLFEDGRHTQSFHSAAISVPAFASLHARAGVL